MADEQKEFTVLFANTILAKDMDQAERIAKAISIMENNNFPNSHTILMINEGRAKL